MALAVRVRLIAADAEAGLGVTAVRIHAGEAEAVCEGAVAVRA